VTTPDERRTQVREAQARYRLTGAHRENQERYIRTTKGMVNKVRGQLRAAHRALEQA
jgi:hypothetical protein